MILAKIFSAALKVEVREYAFALFMEIIVNATNKLTLIMTDRLH